MKTKQRLLPRMSALLGSVGLIIFSPNASAIIDGQLDGEDHPYVGMVAAFDGAGEFLWRGTGTLISPKIVVTAGHVVGLDVASGIEPAFMAVYFDTDLKVSATPHFGIPVPHPGWTGFLTAPNTHDIGVVVLGTPVVMDEYGELPSLGILDSFATARGKKNTTFDVAGYGVQYIRQSPRDLIKLEADPARYQGVVSLVNLNNALSDDYNLMHTGDSGKGNGSGGTAFGDSGGPVFLPGTNIMVGVVSFGLNMQATGPGFAFRTDIEESQDFLEAVFLAFDPANNPFDD